MKLFMIALFAALLRAQEPTGVVEGSLRDAITRAPVASAHLSLRGASTRSCVTALDGGFRFEHLPAGEYALEIEKSGYLDSTRGLAPKAILLKAGAVTESVLLDLTPLGGLEGAVLGEDGKPLAGVNVTVAGTSHTTGKEGLFAFDDLVPGSYQVAVGVPHAVRSANLVRDSSTGDFYGYGAAQYYPGADDVRLAIPVDIPAGARVRNVDLRLRRALLVEFSGRLVELAGGEALFDADVQLATAVPGTPDPLWHRHRVGTDGGFRFSLLQPGSYTLTIYRAGHQLPYLVPIELGKTGVDEMTVPVPPFPRIQGTVSLRDPKLQWQGSGNVRLLARSATAVDVVGLKPDGSFEFAGVPPGEYTVEFLPQNLRLAGDRGRKLFVKELRFGTQTGLRKPIRVVENGNGVLELELSDEPAGIAGKVIQDGARDGKYLVRAAPADPRRVGSYAAVSGGPDFQFPELGPGDYEVTAWRTGTQSQLANIVAGHSCDEAVRVTVRDGAVSNITVRPCSSVSDAR